MLYQKSALGGKFCPCAYRLPTEETSCHQKNKTPYIGILIYTSILSQLIQKIFLSKDQKSGNKQSAAPELTGVSHLEKQ